jgi:hypothetical protein
MISAFLFSTPALAYRSAAIASDSVELKQTADSNSPTLSILAKGTRLNTSDAATNGYFKVRTADSTGWIKTGDLYFYTKPGAGARRQQARRSSKSRHRKYEFVVKGFAGADFWSPSDIDNLLNSSVFNGGTGLGFELGYVLSDDITLVLRVEHLSKSTTGTDTNNNTNPVVTSTITMNYTATPIMVGLDYRLFQWDGWSLEGSGLLGLASPNYTGDVVTGTTDSGPTVFTGSAFTLLIKADLNWEFSDSFWLYAEAGYRSLKTGEVTTTPTSNFFITQGSTSTTQSLTLDMSGPILDIGVRLNL